MIHDARIAQAIASGVDPVLAGLYRTQYLASRRSQIESVRADKQYEANPSIPPNRRFRSWVSHLTRKRS